MKRRQRIAVQIALASAITAAVAGALAWWNHSHLPLPFRDKFTQHDVRGWRPSGGTWRLDGDAINVTSAESGAKLYVGDAGWADYQIWADAQLRSRGGDIGVVARTVLQDDSVEVSPGYVLALRSSDSGLQLTRTAHLALSLPSIYLHGGVRSNVWYRVHLTVYRCRIVAEVTNLRSGQNASLAFDDRPKTCIRTGQAALRTTATSAAWRNVRIERLTEEDKARVSALHVPDAQPAYPLQERDHSAMRAAYLAQVSDADLNRTTELGNFGPVDELERAPLVNIEDLRLRLWNPEPVRIVGVVTSSEPLFLQDGYAGVRVNPPPDEILHSGDEVEMLGRVAADDIRIHFVPTAGHVLNDRTPAVAPSVTATQAATGRYEGSLVELNGIIESSSRSADGGTELVLSDSLQRFAVRVPYDIFNENSLHPERGAWVRVRGVCSSDFVVNPQRGAFVVYAASASNVKLLAGPPWWTGQRLIWMILACSVLLAGGIALYGAIDRAKLRLVQEERERLSHEMHDTLAQSLAGVGFRLRGIYRSLLSSSQVPAVYVEDLKATCDLVAQTHREASSSIAALHPDSQRDGNLLSLLERSVCAMLDDPDFPVILSSSGTPRVLSPAVSDTLFRVGREAIANALRHAGAQSIKVQLAFRSREVVLSITDDGRGFEFASEHAGFGIQSMIRRCNDIHAQLSFRTPDEGGCCVQIVCPYPCGRSLLRDLHRLIRPRR